MTTKDELDDGRKVAATFAGIEKPKRKRRSEK